jgi:purine nucleosidase
MKGKLLSLTAAIMFTMITANAQNFPAIGEIFRLQQLQPPSGKVRMVLDTDTYNEVDDQFALAYACLSDEKIDLEAVYAAPFLNSRSVSPTDGMEKSYNEILRLLAMLGRSPEGFAFRGSETFLKESSVPVGSDAVSDLVRRAMASTPGDPLYVVAIGCITNVASAILTQPEIIRNIVVVWLGGNSLEWPDQREFNLMQDILAAQVVLNSGVPLVIMPCKPVVSHFHTTLPELKHHLGGKNKLADYLVNIVDDYSGGREVYSKVIWDVVAVAWLVNPRWVPTHLVHSPVLTTQLTYSTDRSRHFIRMAASLNRDAIFSDLFRKLAEINP